LQHGQLPAPDLPPRTTTQLSIPVKLFTPEPGVEYFLDLSFRLKRDEPWAKRGHELAWDQFQLPDAAPAPARNRGATGSSAAGTPHPGSPPLTLHETDARVTVSGRKWSVAFDKHNGALASLQIRNSQCIESPLRPDFWRAPTDNDRGRDAARTQGVWRTAHAEAQLKRFGVTAGPEGRSVVVDTSFRLSKVNATWDTRYTVLDTGEIEVAAAFAPDSANLPKLPRLGMQMVLPAGFDRIAWLGRGPQETYADRKDARIGRYQGSVREQFFYDYVEPGESGNKVDVRWVALTNKKGIGLLAVSDPESWLSVNATHHTTDDLQAVAHPFELPHRDVVVLNLDWKQQGVGGDDSWGAWPHEPYLIPCQPQCYRFRLRLLAGGEDPGTVARASVLRASQE
jgi:beta-galactosidase